MTADRRRRGRATRRARRRTSQAIRTDPRSSTVLVDLVVDTVSFERGIRGMSEALSALAAAPMDELAHALRFFARVANAPGTRPRRQLLHNGRKP